MIISEFYQTKIEASSYNVNIDSNNTVITVSLIDFNGAPVTGKSVTLTVDRGYFNKNGSTAISGTTTKSITATTNSNGKITATYTASEWGLATFSANNANIQVKVKGWKSLSTGQYNCKYNEDTVYLSIHIPNTPFPTIYESWGGFTLPSNLRPSTKIVSSNYVYPQHLFIAVEPEDGKIYRVSTKGSQVTTDVYVTFVWNY